MKKFILSLLVFLAATAMQAATALVLHQKTGGIVEYVFLSEKPVVTYEDGMLVITVSETTVLYPLSNMQKFTFEDVDEDQVTRITVPANETPQATQIYNVSGMLVRTLQPGSDGSTSASLDGLPVGTYVIKNGKTTYKVLKR